MKKAKSIACYAVAVTIGIGIGYGLGFSQSHKSLWNQLAVREANDLINRINNLSELRLEHNHAAIESLELFIDAQVLNIAYAEDDQLRLNADSMDPTRLRAIQMAKAYRERYPTDGTNVSPPPATIYSQVPSLSPSMECSNAFRAILTSDSEHSPNQ